MNYRTTALRAATLAALATSAASVAGAQAWDYPSFQQPRAVAREYNFGLADAGHAGTSVVFQWREGLSLGNQMSLDVGVADPDFGDSKFLIGGQFAHQFATSTADMPFDILGTLGANGAFGGGSSLLRIPIGVSVGHRFPLEGGLAITPYVHPRICIDFCSSCGNNGGSDSDIGLDFDIGGDFEFSRQFSLRVSALFSGSDYLGKEDAFGVSLAWRPPGLRR